MGEKGYIQPGETFEAKRFGFTQVVTSPPGTLVFVSGQVGLDRELKLVGEGDVAAQAEKIDGVQHIALLTGGGSDYTDGLVNETATVKYGNFGRLLVFKLDGDAELSAPTVLDRRIPEQAPVTASAADLKRGEELYTLVCTGCHGNLAKSNGVVPDLRLMTDERHAAFNDIVLGGALRGNGMASFADFLNEADAERVHSYIISRAAIDRAEALAEANAGD